MATTADRMIAALRKGHDDLSGMLRGLDPDLLTHRSGAAGWDISQVLSHLGSGAEIGLATLNASLPGGGAPAESNQEIWARWDAMTPEERAVEFLRADGALVSRYESLDAATREDLRIDLGFLPQPVPVAAAAGFRLNESAHHAWDVNVAFDADATLAPEAADVLVDWIGGLFGFLGHADAMDGRAGTLAVETTEPARSFGLDLRDTVALVDTPAQPDGVLTAPAEAWLRLVTGRLAPEHTPADVRVSGDLVGLDDLRRVFPGF
jgi:uncharacterized protein (TIGR03083 family)